MLNASTIRDLLSEVATGAVSVDGAVERLARLPFEQLDVATVDHHRHLRDGFGEVVFSEGKTPAQVADILATLAEVSPTLLATRASEDHYEAARQRVSDLAYHPAARAIWRGRPPVEQRRDGVVVAAAGTSDLNVTEEVVLTLELMGHAPRRLVDVGVAGIHRLFAHLDELRAANVVVAVAGMEGALPGVIAGLIQAPVVAVPTSVGYGTGTGGIAALLGMLNACAAGVAVVNIDNGFGAGYLAAMINAQCTRGEKG